MAIVFSIFLAIFTFIASAVINVGMFLLRRFDVTNSLLVSGVVQLVTIHNPISTSVRWTMFIGIVIVSFVLQHRFKAFRVIFSVASIFAACFIAYAWKHYDTVHNQNMAMLIAGVIVAALNLISWLGISSEGYGLEASV